MNKWKKTAAIMILAAAAGTIAIASLGQYSVWHYVKSALAVSNLSALVERSESAIKGKRESAVFVGDIMLARDVERTLNRAGEGEAFAGLDDLFNAEIVIGNFEAAVPAVHEPTPNFGFKFSVPAGLLPALKEAGLTHLSLANNHALDHGPAGYAHTKSVLSDNDLISFGHPSVVSTSSLVYFDIKNKKVALLGISAVYGYPAETAWRPLLNEAASSSDLQIAFIHWGDEYEPIHNAAQEKFARSLVTAGVDVIVGHHPHVVQDIQRYGSGIVFYSLGNFIFDQYWEDAVRIGLALELVPTKTGWEIDIVPVESKTVKVQPRKMAGEERQKFLAGLADMSDPALAAAIASGTILLQF